MSGDTIYALSSAPGPAGVAVIRLSGPECRAVCHALAGAVPPPRHASLRTLRDPETGEILDRGLVLHFPGPSSFTGEDIAEFHLHGGRAVLDGLFHVLVGMDGLRMAEPGEFSRRAFVNGRMDLTRAEGVADIIAAETAAQRRAALAQAGGALERLYDGWRDRLVRDLAHLEAWLDFPDEDLPDDMLDGLKTRIDALAGEISRHLADARQGERLRDGLTVAIAGPPNAGKSTLLNCLAQRDVAIVSDTPGTTRDVIETHLDLGGYPVVLVDTAGLRETADTIEQEGVRRALKRVESADVVLFLTPAGETADRTYFSNPTPEEGEVGPITLAVVSKADRQTSDILTGNGTDTPLSVSALTGDGIPELLTWLTTRAAELTSSGGRAMPTRLRHREGLGDCLRHLQRATAVTLDTPLELPAEDLRLAMRALGRITGTVDVEDLLDVIFRDFCIGK